jgi:hypothetical protein
MGRKKLDRVAADSKGAARKIAADPLILQRR